MGYYKYYFITTCFIFLLAGCGQPRDEKAESGELGISAVYGYRIKAKPLTVFDSNDYWVADSGEIAQLSVAVRRTGQGTILLDTGPAGGISTITREFDFTFFKLGTEDKLKIWCYFPAESKTAFRVYLGQGGFSKYITKTFSATNKIGWWCFMAKRLDFTEVGSIDWSLPFDTVRIRIDSASPHVQVYLDSMYINSLAVPNVVFTFDDGALSDYTVAFKEMQNVGLSGTSFIVTNGIGTSPYNLSLSQMHEMYSQGWGFANHTMSHIDLTLLNFEQQTSEVGGAKRWLIDNGFLREANYFAYPYGKTNGVRSVLEINEVVAARTTERSFVETASGLPDRYQIPVALSLSSTTTLQDAINAVDEAITSGQSLIIYAHALTETLPGTYQWSAADFRVLIKYVSERQKAGSLAVKTFAEWYSGMNVGTP